MPPGKWPNGACGFGGVSWGWIENHLPTKFDRRFRSLLGGELSGPLSGVPPLITPGARAARRPCIIDSRVQPKQHDAQDRAAHTRHMAEFRLDGLPPDPIDVEVMRYITGGAPWSDEQIRGFVDCQVNLYCERGFCRLKLLEESTGELIGFCGVGFWRDVLDPEIGWWLARRCWGRGLATEAAHSALRDAFEWVR